MICWEEGWKYHTFFVGNGLLCMIGLGRFQSWGSVLCGFIRKGFYRMVASAIIADLPYESHYEFVIERGTMRLVRMEFLGQLEV